MTQQTWDCVKSVYDQLSKDWDLLQLMSSQEMSEEDRELVVLARNCVWEAMDTLGPIVENPIC